MKKTMYILIAFAVLFAVSVNASQVNNVELQYHDGFTSAVISIDGPVRFTHQTEEAKDGKPFRVIVDILSATHELGSKNFYQLPNCPIKAIRTSQFSVSPEKIVRFVFDMDSERVYRIDTDNNSVSLFFSDKSTAKFANWSSAQYIAEQKQKNQPVKIASVQSNETPAVQVATTPEKSASELNKSINTDRLASLGTSTPASTPQANKPVSKPQPTVTKKVENYGPEINQDQLAKDLDAEKTTLAKAEADKKAQALAKAEADKKAQALAKAEADKKAQALAKAEADKKAQALAKAEADKKAQALAKAEADKKAQALAKAEADKKAQALAQADEEKQKSTSRFRRNPVSNKIKGTMVAQFPKRLVVQYKSKSYRDPFATLIDESKTYNNPIEKKIPNVEGLRLVGIIQAEQKSDNSALFEDNDGYGYILKTGDKVRKGYVLRVNSDKVYFQIFEYGWSRTVALTLES